MKRIRTEENRKKEEKFVEYKKLIRNLRRGKIEKINSKKNSHNI
ncbi:MAG: hypothetical protein ACLS67_18450 [Anaerobutyricum soehngenii]